MNPEYLWAALIATASAGLGWSVGYRLGFQAGRMEDLDDDE